MYKFIDPDIVISRIEEWGSKEMLIEIIEMLDSDFNLKTQNLLPAARVLDYKTVEEIVHPLKSNLLLFVNENSEYGKLIKSLLGKSRERNSFRIAEETEIFINDGFSTLQELKKFISNL